MLKKNIWLLKNKTKDLIQLTRFLILWNLIIFEKLKFVIWSFKNVIGCIDSKLTCKMCISYVVTFNKTKNFFI